MSVTNILDINAVDKLGNTPLHIACDKNKLKGVQFLLQNSCKSCILNDSNMAPIHVLVDQGHDKSLSVSIFIIDLCSERVSIYFG